jgi:protein-disulfide isomerase
MPDLEKFKSCVQATDSVPRITADWALAFDTLGIRGTPATIVNGKLYSFAPTIPELIKLVKEAH